MAPLVITIHPEEVVQIWTLIQSMYRTLYQENLLFLWDWICQPWGILLIICWWEADHQCRSLDFWNQFQLFEFQPLSSLLWRPVCCKSWKMDKLSEGLLVMCYDSCKGDNVPTLWRMAKKESRVLLFPLPLTCWEIQRESTTLLANWSYHTWN